MAVPRKIFIDTCVLDRCAYNFESVAIQSLADIAQKEHLTLLLPESTEREMRRHIKRRSEDVLAVLLKAQQSAPFLRKWKEWPLKGEPYRDFFLAPTLKKIATKELDGFLALFELVKLDTTHINLPDVMEWYDEGTAPFGPKRKKAEFPDAFALSSLLTFAKKHGETIAIISSDGDFQNASALHDCLFFYRTAGAYVESLLLSDEHVKKVRAILDSNAELISEGLTEKFEALGFYPTDDERAELEDVEVDEINFTDLSIVGTGEKEVSVSFEAEVAFTIDASFGETDWDGPAQRTERVSDFATVAGIAKLTVSADWSDFESLELLRLDEEEIGVEARQSEWDEY
jgi:hypothetical protein